MSREFWIEEKKLHGGIILEAYWAKCPQGIHVIEYSAHEELASDCRALHEGAKAQRLEIIKLTAERDRYKAALEGIIEDYYIEPDVLKFIEDTLDTTMRSSNGF